MPRRDAHPPLRTRKTQTMFPDVEFKLAVQSQQQERQIRRLGAAVGLMWPTFSPEVQDALVAQACRIKISGETVSASDLRTRLLAFLNSAALQSELLEEDRGE